MIQKQTEKNSKQFYPTMGLLVLIFVPSLLLNFNCQKQDQNQNSDLIQLLNSKDRMTSKNEEKYVLSGQNGHLFYLEDLRASLIKWTHLEANITLISDLSAHLKSRGVRLILVPVPTKVEIYPEFLGGQPNTPSLSKDLFLYGLERSGVEYLDFREAFSLVKNEQSLFPRTDTHWDVDAICLAAEAIAFRIKPITQPNLQPLIDTLLLGFKGDLADKFSLNQSDTVHLKMVGDGRGGPYKEPDSSEVVLYGDSFLNQYKRHGGHLGAHLSRELGEPVRTVYSLAGFTNGPMKIKELVSESMPGVKVVVWVFTSRTLMESTN